MFILTSMTMVVGCSKKAPSSGGTSQVSFSLPANFSNGAFAGTACFAVSIESPESTAVVPDACDGAETYETFAGLAPLGGTLELEASKGAARVIKIFYVISDVGCSEFDPLLSLGKTYGSNRVFKIGEKTQDFEKSTEIVQIEIQYPSGQNTLSALYQGSATPIPVACEKASSFISISNRQVLPVVGSYRGTTDAGSKVHIRVSDKQIKFENPTSWPGQLRPMRLGVEQ